MPAYCGLKCEECPVLIATVNDDDKLRNETASQWSGFFEKGLAPEDIYCDGCKAGEGIIFKWCAACPARSCAADKDLANCGLCGDYPCEKLEEIHRLNPDAKPVLDAIFEKTFGG